MARPRPPWMVYVLVALGCAYALPTEQAINPLLETAYLAPSVGLVMAAAWRWGLQAGLQAAIICALANNLLSLGRNGALGASLAQFGVFMLAALVVSARRPLRASGMAGWRDGGMACEQEGRMAGERAGGTGIAVQPPGGLRELFEGVSDAILAADAEGRCLAANERMAALTGFTPDELRSLPANRVVAPAHRWTDEERAEFGLTGHWRGPLTLRRKDGPATVVDARLVLLELPSGIVYLTAIGAPHA